MPKYGFRFVSTCKVPFNGTCFHIRCLFLIFPPLDAKKKLVATTFKVFIDVFNVVQHKTQPSPLSHGVAGAPSRLCFLFDLFFLYQPHKSPPPFERPIWSNQVDRPGGEPPKQKNQRTPPWARLDSREKIQENLTKIYRMAGRDKRMLLKRNHPASNPSFCIILIFPRLNAPAAPLGGGVFFRWG